MRIEAVSLRHVERFLDVAGKLYPPSSPWVSPLYRERRRFFDPARNPFFDHAEMQLFIAVDASGEDRGRIAAIDNARFNSYHGSSLGFFGFFETADDSEISAALVEAASQWVEQRSCTHLYGPVSPSTNHECGLLVEGFDLPPMIQMPYNPSYYEEHLLRAGFRGVQDLVAFRYRIDGRIPARLRRAQEIFKSRKNFTLRRANLRQFDEELARLRLIYNEAWARNEGFVPLTERELDSIARELRPVIDPEFCWFAEVQGEPAGVALAVPDVNQALKPLCGKLFPFGWFRLLVGMHRIDRLRAMVLGVRPRFRKRGIDYALYHEGLVAAQRRGFRQVELSWVLADNVAIVRPVEAAGGRIYKRYRLYEKEVLPPPVQTNSSSSSSSFSIAQSTIPPRTPTRTKTRANPSPGDGWRFASLA